MSLLDIPISQLEDFLSKASRKKHKTTRACKNKRKQRNRVRNGMAKESRRKNRG